MRKLCFLFAALITVGLAFTSCGKKGPMTSAEFKSQLTAEDTTNMLAICDSCMRALKQGQTDKAIGMLHLYDDSTQQLLPLTDEKVKELENTFRLFPVLDYTLDYFSFNKEGVNDVKYNIKIFEQQPGDNTPNTIGFMFNPVRVEGTWYLTVKAPDQEVDSLKR